MLIIVGLGNPGIKYSKTKHNAGFDALDFFAKKHGIKINKRKCKALIGQGEIAGEQVVLVKPQTFMNSSGEAVSAVLDMYDASPEDDLLVLSDDLTLDCGNIRLRRSGSAGGHNGLKSIIAFCDTKDFARLRIGIGKVPESSDIITHVLSRFTRADRADLERSFVTISEALETIISQAHDMDQAIVDAQSRYNGKC